MRFRRIVSDVLFTVSALVAAVSVHKYVFGDFPKLWLVRDWPWHMVNPWVAGSIALVLAFVAARLARSPDTGLALGAPASRANGVLPAEAEYLTSNRDVQREPVVERSARPRVPDPPADRQA